MYVLPAHPIFYFNHTEVPAKKLEV